MSERYSFGSLKSPSRREFPLSGPVLVYIDHGASPPGPTGTPGHSPRSHHIRGKVSRQSRRPWRHVRSLVHHPSGHQWPDTPTPTQSSPPCQRNGPKGLPHARRRTRRRPSGSNPVSYTNVVQSRIESHCVTANVCSGSARLMWWTACFRKAESRNSSKMNDHDCDHSLVLNPV